MKEINVADPKLFFYFTFFYIFIFLKETIVKLRATMSANHVEAKVK